MKYLKMTICAALMLTLLLTLSACGSDGTYFLTEATIDGQTYSADDFKAQGSDPVNCYVILNADGTGELNFFGDVLIIEWKGSKMWPAGFEDDSIPFQQSGNTLKFETNGNQMTFTRK